MFDAQSGMALLIAVIAGLSTLVGAAIVIISGKRNNFILTLALGLAAGVMLSVAFTDLLPEGEEYFTSWGGETMGVILSVVFAVAGLVIAVLADKIIPDGCHDGHNHHHDHFAEESDHCDGTFPVSA
jgi:ZIP family zinc transporter